MREWSALLSQSALYVSLEPCAHYGKTPPCTDLIIREGIRKVFIGCLDPFKEVDGKGVSRLLDAGADVQSGILEEECKQLNRRFFTFHTKQRPYILLKWAETGDGKIARGDYSRLFISGDLTNRLTHKWRSEEAGLMAGANTVLFDDPFMTNRLWSGKSPVRLVIDMELRLPSSLNVFNREVKTIVFNSKKQEESDNLLFYRINKERNVVQQVVSALFALNISSVMVEGGLRLLQSFITEGLWDEARVITNRAMIAGDGIPSPVLKDQYLVGAEVSGSDTIQYFKNNQ